MRPHLVTFDGSTFMITNSNGDAGEREECVGLFWRDTRHLSEWQVLVDDTPLEQLTVRNGQALPLCPWRVLHGAQWSELETAPKPAASAVTTKSTSSLGGNCSCEAW